MSCSYIYVALIVLCFGFVRCTKQSQQDPTPYKFMLDEYSKHVELGCDEKLMGWDYGISYNPWVDDYIMEMATSLPRWQDDYLNDYENVLSQFYREVITGVLAMTPQQATCLTKAMTILDNTTNPVYESSIDLNDWYTNFANGEYNKTVNFTSNYISENQTATATVWSNTLARVDVRPSGWFIQSVLWLIRNSVIKNGMCDSDTLVESCLFDPETGIFNSIITGFVVISGCERIETFVGGNSTITCQPDTPYMLAWIVQELPQRDAWC